MQLLVAIALLASAPAEAATPGVVGELEQSASTTPKQKSEFAAAAVSEIDGAVTTVSKLLETARNAKEPDKEEIQCLEDKLPQLTTIAEVAKKTSTSMEQHLAANDLAHADQEYRQLAVLLTRAREFLVEAQQCVKGAGSTKGKTASTLSSDDAANTVDGTDEIEPVPDVPITPV
ncbi:MAG: hypothetical protein FJ102_12090 [Deltaproteobacteria bacterium]|nr:hypothetical protein [Deltaproteobacteria bacterium]